MKLRLFVIVLSLFLSSCATPTSDYLAEKPILIIAGKQSVNSELQEKAAAIFLKTLNKYNWEIRSFEDNIVVAEACRRGMHCAEITATILEDASVSIIRSPGQVLSLNEGSMLKQWVGKIKREYLKNLRYVR